MGCGNPVDDKAKAIIRLAQDKNISIEKRAMDLVSRILRTYYANEVSKVQRITYIDHIPDDDFKGLDTTSSGTGDSATGIVRVVSPYYVEQATEQGFARRVLQLGHELQHIDQYRARMTGKDKSSEREFLAFHWEALAAEKPGTGCINTGTRGSLIDGALKYYDKMPHDAQERHRDRRAQLLERQQKAIAATR